MSIRTLFAIVVAMAVLLAPAVARAGEAFTPVPDHHAQMMKSGYCEMTPKTMSGDERTMPPMSCCASICLAVPASVSAPTGGDEVNNGPGVFAPPTFQVGVPAEIATPPPRFA